MPSESLIEAARWIREHCLVCDTETTGVGDDDSVIEIAIVDPLDRSTLLNELVAPLSYLSPESVAVHGITPEELKSSGKDFSHIANAIREVGIGHTRHLTSYNLPFDMRLLQQTAIKAGCTPIAGHEPHLAGVNSICIMELANRYFSDHLKWDTEKSQFKRLSLKSCMAIAGLEYQGTAHRALADALAASDLLNHMAKGL